MTATAGFRSLVLSAFLTLGLATAFAPSAHAGAGVGDKFPDFSIKSLDGKKTVSNKDFKGKVVIVDLWASWCEPCKVEMPALDKLYKKHKSKGLHIVGVSLDDEPDKAKEFLKANPVKFQVAYDGKEKALLGKIGDPSAMPTSYILDRDGTIKHIHKGFVEENIKDFEKEVGELIGKKK